MGNPVDVGDWNDAGNWNPNGVPTSTDVACIPAGSTVQINETTEFAEAVWIKSDATNGDEMIEILGSSSGGSLTLYADSTINGEMKATFRGRIFINTSITIDGKGEIDLAPYSQTVYPIIDGVGGIPYTLTLTGAGTGAWDDRTDSLVLEGSVISMSSWSTTPM